MLDNKPQIDTTWNLKWKTSTEDWLVKLLYLIRTQKETTQEQQHALRKLKEWSSRRCRYGGVGYIFDHTDGRNAYFDKGFKMERLLGILECPKKF